MAYSEIPFSKNSYHIETSQLICFLVDFCMIRVFTQKGSKQTLDTIPLNRLCTKMLYLWKKKVTSKCCCILLPSLVEKKVKLACESLEKL